MKYMGSKNRHAKHILPIMLKDRKPGQMYVEPFVGGFNLIDKVENPRIGADAHEYLITLFKEVQKGWEPPEFVTESKYQEIKKFPNRQFPALVGFVGFGCSYASKWWGGYARNVKKDAPNAELLNSTTKSYCAQSKRNILKQYEAIQGIDIRHSNYQDLDIPPNSIIYCDPPYENTTKYKANKEEFNHQEFFQWCRDKKAQGHTVFVSEYNAPEDFTCVWSKEVNNSLTKDTGSKKGIEKLFKV
jgi:DNA adenine methylase